MKTRKNKSGNQKRINITTIIEIGYKCISTLSILIQIINNM